MDISRPFRGSSLTEALDLSEGWAAACRIRGGIRSTCNEVVVSTFEGAGNVFKSPFREPTHDLIEAVKVVDLRAQGVKPAVEVLFAKAVANIGYALVEGKPRHCSPRIHIGRDLSEILQVIGSGLSINHGEEISTGAYRVGYIR